MNQLPIFVKIYTIYSTIMKQKLALLAIPAMALLSCSKDKLDFDMVDDIKWKPNVEAPLVVARLSLEDLDEKDSNLVADSDNALRVRFRKDSLFYFSALDFVKIPAQNPVGVPLSLSNSQINSDLELGTLGGVELRNAQFTKGALGIQLDISSGVPSDVMVRISINNADVNGVVAEKTVTLPANNIYIEDSLNLALADFDFTDGQQKVNFISLSLEVLNPVALGGEIVTVTTQFRNLELENAEGFFGQRYINIPAGNFDFDIAGISEFTNGLFLTDPSLKLVTTSTLGASLGLELDLDGVNEDGNVVSLDAEAQLLAAASSPQNPNTSDIEYNGNNSGIAEFLANLPNNILYSGRAEINPPGESQNNFINRNSGVSANLEVDIPLKFTAKNVKLDEILDVDFFKENPEEVDEVTLIFYSDNGLPFEMGVNVAFLEAETGDSLQGFSLPLLDAAPVDGNGRVIRNAPQKRVEVKITKDMVEDLSRCDKLRFVGSLKTGSNGDDVAALYTDYELTIKVAAKAKLNL